MTVLKKANLLRIEDWGLISYAQAWEKQKQCVDKVLQGSAQVLIFCEHPSVVTLGRLAQKDNILLPLDEMKKRNIFNGNKKLT